MDYYKSWLAIGDRPLIAKGIDVTEFQTMAGNSRYVAVVSVCLFKIIFCLTSWFLLKQLDNLPSLRKNDW